MLLTAIIRLIVSKTVCEACMFYVPVFLFVTLYRETNRHRHACKQTNRQTDRYWVYVMSIYAIDRILIIQRQRWSEAAENSRERQQQRRRSGLDWTAVFLQSSFVLPRRRRPAGKLNTARRSSSFILQSTRQIRRASALRMRQFVDVVIASVETCWSVDWSVVVTDSLSHVPRVRRELSGVLRTKTVFLIRTRVVVVVALSASVWPHRHATTYSERTSLSLIFVCSGTEETAEAETSIYIQQ